MHFGISYTILHSSIRHLHLWCIYQSENGAGPSFTQIPVIHTPSLTLPHHLHSHSLKLRSHLEKENISENIQPCSFMHSTHQALRLVNKPSLNGHNLPKYPLLTSKVLTLATPKERSRRKSPRYTDTSINCRHTLIALSILFLFFVPAEGH